MVKPLSRPSPMIQAVTFDVTNTLLHCPRLGEIYSEVLARHGIEVEPREARRLIGVVWQELACAAEPGRDRFTAHPEGARGWWRWFLTRFCEHLDAPPPSPFAAAELYHRFAQRESWEIYPEVTSILDQLRARQVLLGVVSNWDHRLPALLADLGLAHRFDAVVYSSAAGMEKPDPRIFQQAIAALGLGPAAAVLHVGDHQIEDVEGAVAAGMRALLIRRGEAQKHPSLRGETAHVSHASHASHAAHASNTAGYLRDLSLLPQLVASGRLETCEPGSPAL
jgi:REG-2-like HAD superfamily hydrolase